MLLQQAGGIDHRQIKTSNGEARAGGRHSLPPSLALVQITLSNRFTLHLISIYLATLALIVSRVAVTFSNYLERSPPLATDNLPGQTERRVASQQSPSHDGQGSIKAKKWGGLDYCYICYLAPGLLCLNSYAEASETQKTNQTRIYSIYDRLKQKVGQAFLAGTKTDEE